MKFFYKFFVRPSDGVSLHAGIYGICNNRNNQLCIDNLEALERPPLVRHYLRMWVGMVMICHKYDFLLTCSDLLL